MTTASSINDVDWPAFLGQHDMRFTELPRSWHEAPHFGNAMVGSMLYQVGEALHLQVFRADVQDHRDESHGWTAYSRPRLMIGHFELHTVGQLTGCDWRKNLWNAELTGTITTDRGEIQIRHFTHAVDMAIVTELTPDEGESDCTWTWHPHPAETTRPGYPADDRSRREYAERYGKKYLDRLNPWTANPDGRTETRGMVDVWRQGLLAGGQYATAWSETHSDSTRTQFVSIANSYPEATAADTAVADVERCVSVDRESWLDQHRQWWHDYLSRSYVSLPDKQVEGLYWQTVYRLGCTSRAGRFYVDTSSMWFQGGPWPYSTHDWNTQAAHWGVYAANRLEQGQEIVDRLHRHRDNLIDAVRPESWQEDCAYLTLATAGDMIGERDGDMRYYHLVGCLPWILHNAWWQYRFSMDDRMLREKIFPLLRRAVNLYLRLAEEGEDGRIHLSPTYSPETGVYRDANFDLSLFKWACHTLLHACKRLNIEDELIPTWQDVVDRLFDFPTDDESFMLAGGEPAPKYHRHLSHLLMIYPLYLVNIDQPGTESVLHHAHRRVQVAVMGEGNESAPNQAMIQTHAAPIACALGKGDEALDGLRRQIAELLPNGLWPCGGNPCFESSVSLMSIVQDMLIQSWSDPASDEPGPIRIFPATPTAWQDVTFHNLRAEGAFLVSAERAEGRTRWARIESLAGEPCRVRLDTTNKPTVRGQRDCAITEIQPGLYHIDLRQGETIELILQD